MLINGKVEDIFDCLVSQKEVESIKLLMASL